MAAVASLASEGGQGRQAAELVNVSHITVIKQIGRGGFARVYSAEYHPPCRERQRVALKVLKLPDNSDETRKTVWERLFLSEGRSGAALFHTNLTRCFGLVRLDEDCPLNLGPGLPLPTWGMLLELCEGGTLRDKLVHGMSHGRRTYSDTAALDWLCDTAAALQHLHTSTPPIIHRDIKAENILLHRTAEGCKVAKLADLGLHVRVADERSVMLRRKGALAALDGGGASSTFVAITPPASTLASYTGSLCDNAHEDGLHGAEVVVEGEDGARSGGGSRASNAAALCTIDDLDFDAQALTDSGYCGSGFGQVEPLPVASAAGQALLPVSTDRAASGRATRNVPGAAGYKATDAANEERRGLHTEAGISELQEVLRGQERGRALPVAAGGIWEVAGARGQALGLGAAKAVAASNGWSCSGGVSAGQRRSAPGSTARAEADGRQKEWPQPLQPQLQPSVSLSCNGRQRGDEERYAAATAGVKGALAGALSGRTSPAAAKSIPPGDLSSRGYSGNGSCSIVGHGGLGGSDSPASVAVAGLGAVVVGGSSEGASTGVGAGGSSPGASVLTDCTSSGATAQVVLTTTSATTITGGALDTAATAITTGGGGGGVRGNSSPVPVLSTADADAAALSSPPVSDDAASGAANTCAKRRAAAPGDMAWQQDLVRDEGAGASPLAMGTASVATGLARLLPSRSAARLLSGSLAVPAARIFDRRSSSVGSVSVSVSLYHGSPEAPTTLQVSPPALSGSLPPAGGQPLRMYDNSLASLRAPSTTQEGILAPLLSTADAEVLVGASGLPPGWQGTRNCNPAYVAGSEEQNSATSAVNVAALARAVPRGEASLAGMLQEPDASLKLDARSSLEGAPELCPDASTAPLLPPRGLPPCILAGKGRLAPWRGTPPAQDGSKAEAGSATEQQQRRQEQQQTPASLPLPMELPPVCVESGGAISAASGAATGTASQPPSALLMPLLPQLPGSLRLTPHGPLRPLQPTLPDLPCSSPVHVPTDNSNALPASDSSSMNAAALTSSGRGSVDLSAALVAAGIRQLDSTGPHTHVGSPVHTASLFTALRLGRFSTNDTGSGAVLERGAGAVSPQGGGSPPTPPSAGAEAGRLEGDDVCYQNASVKGGVACLSALRANTPEPATGEGSAADVALGGGGGARPSVAVAASWPARTPPHAPSHPLPLPLAAPNDWDRLDKSSESSAHIGEQQAPHGLTRNASTPAELELLIPHKPYQQRREAPVVAGPTSLLPADPGGGTPPPAGSSSLPPAYDGLRANRPRHLIVQVPPRRLSTASSPLNPACATHSAKCLHHQLPGNAVANSRPTAHTDPRARTLGRSRTLCPGSMLRTTAAALAAAGATAATAADAAPVAIRPLAHLATQRGAGSPISLGLMHEDSLRSLFSSKADSEGCHSAPLSSRQGASPAGALSPGALLCTFGSLSSVQQATQEQQQHHYQQQQQQPGGLASGNRHAAFPRRNRSAAGGLTRDAGQLCPNGALSPGMCNPPRSFHGRALGARQSTVGRLSAPLQPEDVPWGTNQHHQQEHRPSCPPHDLGSSRHGHGIGSGAAVAPLAAAVGGAAAPYEPKFTSALDQQQRDRGAERSRQDTGLLSNGLAVPGAAPVLAAASAPLPRASPAVSAVLEVSKESFSHHMRRVGSIAKLLNAPPSGPLPQHTDFDWVYGLTGQAGSCFYMAPEVFLRQPYNCKVDTFSFGVLMYELLSRELLLVSYMNTSRAARLGIKRPADYAKLVSEGYRPPRPPRVSAEQWALVEACWHQDPCERPAMAQVLQELGELRAKAAEAASAAPSRAASRGRSSGAWAGVSGRAAASQAGGREAATAGSAAAAGSPERGGFGKPPACGCACVIS